MDKTEIEYFIFKYKECPIICLDEGLAGAIWASPMVVLNICENIIFNASQLDVSNERWEEMLENKELVHVRSQQDKVGLVYSPINFYKNALLTIFFDKDIGLSKKYSKINLKNLLIHIYLPKGNDYFTFFCADDYGWTRCVTAACVKYEYRDKYIGSKKRNA